MAKRNLKFYVSKNNLRLNLEDLWAAVHVSVGIAGEAAVTLEGNEKLLDYIEVTGGSNEVTVKGKGGQDGGNMVIVNGKVVSGGEDVTVVEGAEMPKVTITVPQGTNLHVCNVESTKAVGLGGHVNASLSGQVELQVSKANGMKIECSGQSQCYINDATGNLKASTRGQSVIDVTGNLGDVEADSSGQSHISVNGNCQHFKGKTSGQSRIIVSGICSGSITKEESGTSKIVFR